MKQEQRMMIAMLLSLIVITLWQDFYHKPLMQKQIQAQSNVTLETPTTVSDNNALAPLRYITINNNQVSGSINLQGLRIDNILLKQYKKTVDDIEPVHLLSYSNDQKYFATIGWSSSDKSLILPDSKTQWETNDTNLSPNHPIILTWKSPQGNIFVVNISITDDFIFDFNTKVFNNTDKTIDVVTYGIINRSMAGTDQSLVLHEGGLVTVNNDIKEIKFDDINNNLWKAIKGWIGFTDKYWLTAFIANPEQSFEAKLASFTISGQKRYQADFMLPMQSIKPSTDSTQNFKFFAGVKKLDLLDFYASKYNIPLFDRALDFGTLYFITKPFLEILHFLYHYFGNFGVAIIFFTLVIKILLFPLAYQGFKNMNRLRALQPKIEIIKKQYSDKPEEIQAKMIELYRKEKINPLSTIWPILIQAPIFFALYKVLYISIEIRHAPLFGWIKDLSVREPTTVFNLFGLISWDPPSFLMIGIFPIVMALTMYIQQLMAPEVVDPTQAKAMRFLPIIFLFMMSSFPVGLILYWIWSNIFSILQQTLIRVLDSTPNKASKYTLGMNKKKQAEIMQRQ